MNHHTKIDLTDNLNNWNDRAVVHANGGYGDLAAFASNKQAITATVKRDLAVIRPFLPDQKLTGQHLLHLQCHIGDDTLSWARLGASDVYGLDFSPVALTAARKLATAAQIPITYVEGDAGLAAQAMPEQLAQFNAIVTSAGTITWLPELKSWAESIAQLLAPGGVFMIRDNHPLLFALENAGLEIKQDYFSGTEDTYESDSSYTSNSAGKINHQVNHNWAHDFQEIINSLIGAGLTIKNVGEHRITDWQALPSLIYSKDHEGWELPATSPQFPLTFSVVAQKP
ncbi:class I SAM-dependent methyltransferase [Lactobacillus xylocopicola]|uniref:SAM-dependent methyltransferase n=1 Tax=Lactobacillus xylocopicola TaxID=2976676 RepID=A0ABN6SHZ2_9LACO|nr:class I SAM-dependent methyltransferase [Lactobacillus xylocopicola]BDR59910.1 SAM-dependent methyltransferase [Lactobacillus xylocopicola]